MEGCGSVMLGKLGFHVERLTKKIFVQISGKSQENRVQRFRKSPPKMTECRFFFSKLCWGKVMATYTKPQQWKKGKGERLRGEGEENQVF